MRMFGQRWWMGSKLLPGQYSTGADTSLTVCRGCGLGGVENFGGEVHAMEHPLSHGCGIPSKFHGESPLLKNLSVHRSTDEGIQGDS